MRHLILTFTLLAFMAAGCTPPKGSPNAVHIPGSESDTTNTWAPAPGQDPQANQRVAQPVATTARQGQEDQIVIQEVAPPTYNFLWATGPDVQTMERGNGWSTGEPINQHTYGGYVEGFGIGNYILGNKSRFLNTNRQPKDVIADILRVTRTLDIAMTWSVRNAEQTNAYYLAIVEQVALTKNMVGATIDAYDKTTTASTPMRNRSALKDYENFLVGLESQLGRFLDSGNSEHLSFVHPFRRRGIADKAPLVVANTSKMWERGSRFAF